jgi:hypothetical protein
MWNPATTTDFWACSDCGNVQGAQGKCGRCNSDPLLDMRDVRVRDALVQEDDARKDSREGRVRWLGVGVGIVSVVAACFSVREIALFAASFFGGGFVVMAAGLGIATMATLKVVLPFKPRFPQLRG